MPDVGQAAGIGADQVGGNLPGVTRTVSISIYDEVQALNYAAAKLLTTDNWLFYTTFVDIFIVMGLAYFVVRFARGAKVQPDA